MGKAFPRCFDLVLPHFQLSHYAFPSSHSVCLVPFLFSPPPLPSCLFQPLSLFLSLFASVCSFFCLFSPSLRQSVGEESRDLFKISKDRSGGLASPSLSTHSPSLLLTDKQKSEPAVLAVYCLPSLLYPSLLSSWGGVDCWLVLIYVCER